MRNISSHFALRSASSIVLFVVATVLGFAQDQAPNLVGGGNLELKRPEMFRGGWIDFNKNGKMEPYENPGLPTEERVSDLLARMNRVERIGQLWQRSMKNRSAAQESELISTGRIGSYLGAAPDAGPRNQLQRVAVEESRLGIPLIFGYDTIHGFRTIYPIPLAQSCSWDPSLIERIGTAAAAESAAAGVDWVFAPMVDIARDPRWGRIAEGFGEDPWLDSQFAAAAVRGFQGSDPSQPNRVAACLKHYVGYGAAEGGRDYDSTEIGRFTLRNVYLPAFKAGVDAGALTLMSAFNSLNSVPTSANHFTLTDVLRQEWKFNGFVVSDWNAVGQLVTHGYAADEAEAGAMGITAGVDMEMTSQCYSQNLAALMDSGKVDPAVVDEAVRRILRVKFQRGLFERPYADGHASGGREAQQSRVTLAREAVAKSCVLLKNSGVLPLRPNGGTVALIGPFADNRNDLLGCWSALGRKEDVVNLQEGMAAALPGVKLVVASGCAIISQEIKPLAEEKIDDATKEAHAAGGGDQSMDEAVAMAKAADVVILALGEPSLWSGEAKCRLDLVLPGAQQELFDRVVATGKPVVVVLFAGRPLAIPIVMEKAAAVLMAWHPGVQAGSGVADVLTGVTDPTGRLTVTFPRSVGQVPVYYNRLGTSRRLDEYYRDGTRQPLLPFGFGLTYTTFEYGPTHLSSSTMPRAGTITVTTTVTNTGKRTGTEVVQLYVHDVACSLGSRPLRELKGFRRVTLPPGGTQEISFTLNESDLGCLNEEGQWVTQPGRFEVTLAPNAASGAMVGFTLAP